MNFFRRNSDKFSVISTDAYEMPRYICGDTYKKYSTNHIKNCNICKNIREKDKIRSIFNYKK